MLFKYSFTVLRGYFIHLNKFDGHFLCLNLAKIRDTVPLTFVFVFHPPTEAIAGATAGAASRPTSPVPNAPADVAIEIDEDPPEAADSEPLVG